MISMDSGLCLMVVIYLTIVAVVWLITRSDS